MKRSIGIYLLLAGILMGFYLLMNVYVPSQIPAAVATDPVVDSSMSIAQADMVQNSAPKVEYDVQAVTFDEVIGEPAEQRTTEPAIEYAIEPRPELRTELTPEPEPKPQVVAQNKFASKKYENPLHTAKDKASVFSVPSGLKKEVDFWVKVYTQYSNDQAVLHDPADLGRTYGVVELPHCADPPTRECMKRREDAIQDAKDAVYEKLDPKGKKRDTDDMPKVRAQVGQKDKFTGALVVANKLIPKLEKQMESSGMPKELSRLPFVESMFNTKARSHAGAAGIWQLMPKSAKILGLKVTKSVDERLDISRATDAAMKHLKRDYNRLGSWPLAVNAYNAGPGRLADAVNQLGTTDIARITKNYVHPAYGFAARNFYPCFLAVLHAYEGRDVYFGGRAKDVIAEEHIDLAPIEEYTDLAPEKKAPVKAKKKKVKR